MHPDGAVVELSITLLDKCKSKTRTGKSSLHESVWKLGRDVGMYELTTSTLSNCGYIFAFGGKRWKSNEHPNLTLAQAGVTKSGDLVEYSGDFDPIAPPVPGAVPSAGPGAPGSIEVKVTLQDITKSVTRIQRTSPEKCVWSFGEEVGMTGLKTSALSHGQYAFRFKGQQWCSVKHPTVTLAQLGVAHGDAVEFLADLEAAAPSRGGTGGASRVELQVTLADKFKSWTETRQASLDQCVWRFGEDAGMRKLTTGPLSNYGFVFHHGGKEWRSNQHPKLTLAEAGVVGGEAVEFGGDFEPVAAFVAPSPLVELHVTLLDRSKSSTAIGKTCLEKCVWRFGMEVGMQKLTTSTLSNNGYLFRFGGKQWRSNQDPNLTLAEAGVCKEGEMVEFLGDFEPVAKP
ncbi:unnamed protein product [Durusdinium trenchii]|uniref:Uncharacterized protein n=1 Tax=Durusdinium trenchii TaxID=1381693 RepID=A0ABP0K524_9DINO